MDATIAFPILAIAVLLLLSAFFSGSETALTAASRPLMHQLERRGSRRARLVGDLMARRERLIGTILMGNNLVNILAAALATEMLIGFFGNAGVAYATAIMTALVLIFAEIMPKTYALNHADRSAIAVAPVLRPLVAILSPISGALQVIVRGLLRAFGTKIDSSAVPGSPTDELRGAIDLHSRDGALIKHERDMLGGILDLPEIDVSDIMVHRKDIVTIDLDQGPEKILDEAFASPYTRIPLWRDDPENIGGVLHVKDLIRARERAGDNLGELKPGDLANPPWFIPETTSVATQLRAFLRRRSHFSLVVDEYGALMGLVTLEDILEEIVGDIADEHDITVTGVQPEPDGSYVVQGLVTIRDLNRRFDWSLPDEEAATIAGLIIHEARVIPEEGQIFSFHGFTFEILRRQRNQIVSLRIRPDIVGRGPT